MGSNCTPFEFEDLPMFSHAAATKGCVLPPRRCDVVVIGGGIIGCSTAYFLAKRGLRVVLCEKGRIGGEQSGRSWGFVRQQGSVPAELPTIIDSMRIWCGLAKELGEDVGFHQAGGIYLANTEQEAGDQARWLEHAQQHQLDTRQLSGQEVKRLLPYLRGSWRSALHTASDGRAEPDKAASAIARGAQHRGATLLHRCAVRTVETEAGRVVGVMTERGEIRAQSVVCAAGVWSSLFCGNLGVSLPQLKLRASVLRTQPAPVVTHGAVWSQGLNMRRRQDGGYTIAHGSLVEHDLVPDTVRFYRSFKPVYELDPEGVKLRWGRQFFTELMTPTKWDADEVSPFERARVLDPKPSPVILHHALNTARDMFPPLRGAQVVRRWAGFMDAMPDAVPVISPVGYPQGCYLATGFSGRGFGIGPGAGKLTADMVTGRASAVALEPFRFARFNDGSKVAPDAAS